LLMIDAYLSLHFRLKIQVVPPNMGEIFLSPLVKD